MLPPSRYPRQRLLITLTLATGLPSALVLGLIVLTTNDSWWDGLVAAGALMLPPIIIAGLLTEATRNSLGLVLAYACLFFLAGGALFGAIFWYGIAFLTASWGGRPMFMLIELAMVAPYLVLGVAASRTTKDVFGDAIVQETGTHLLSVVLLYLVALGLGTGLAGEASPREPHFREPRSKWVASDALRRSVFRVQACAIGYAFAHPDSGYPPSLAAMGPSGQNCLDKRLAKGQAKGLLVAYEPAPPNAAGRIPSFIVRARATRKGPAPGESRSVIGDTSGFVGETRGTETAARIGVPGDEMIDQVAHLRTCALLARAKHREGTVPSSIAEMAAKLGHFGDGDLRAYFCDRGTLEHYAHLEARDSLGMEAGYRASYAAIRDSAGRFKNFEIVARPIAYGESGIRSYVVRSDGPMHVTLADRAATPSDPAVPACEYGEKWSGLPRYTSTVVCARMPSIEPPAVALIHDTVATAGQPFIVAVRDKADPARPADPTHEHHLSCGTTPASWFPPPSSASQLFRLGSELDCAIHVDPRRPSSADRMYIVLYTRDRSGAIGMLRSVVRLVR